MRIKPLICHISYRKLCLKYCVSVNSQFAFDLASKNRETLLSFQTEKENLAREEEVPEKLMMEHFQQVQQAERDLEAAQQALNNAKAQQFLHTFNFPIEQTKPGPAPMDVDETHEAIANLARDFDTKLDGFEHKFEMLKKRVLHLERSTETDTHYSDLRELCTSENPRKRDTFGKSIIFGKGRAIPDRRAPLQRNYDQHDRRDDRQGDKDRRGYQSSYDHRRERGYGYDERRSYGKKY